MANINHKDTAKQYLISSISCGNVERANAHALLYIGDMIGELAKVLKDSNEIETNTGFYIKDLNV